MAGKFDGKVVLITGAAGGVADGVVREFASHGAKLVLVDHSEDRLQQKVAEWDDLLGEYLIATGDLGKPDEVQAVIEKAVQAYGQIDVAAHIAGGFHFGKPVHEADVDALEKMLYLNTRLTWVTLGGIARHMVEHGVKGSLIGVTARSGRSGAKNMAAYVASKAAVQRIIESMALELKEHDIRVNAVEPSIVDTPANRADMGEENAHKWVTPKQIGQAMVFLASDEATAITGQILGVYNKV